MPIYMQTQTNIYEIVIEMNIRQLNIERRTDEIETELQRLQVTKIIKLPTLLLYLFPCTSKTVA